MELIWTKLYFLETVKKNYSLTPLGAQRSFMGNDEDQAQEKSVKPLTLQAVDSIHRLINRLEDKLAPVIRPIPESDKKSAPEGSALMQELTSAETRLKSLLLRIHI